MQSGKLRHRINILAASNALDSYGQPGNPIAFLTVWASIDALLGKELAKAQQVVAEVTHKVTMRYQPNVTADMLIDFKGRIFQVQAVMNPKELNQQLELLCLERNDGTNQRPAMFLVSGTVSNGAGATVVLNGLNTVVVTADGSGNFSAYMLNSTCTVTPTKAGMSMTPASLSVTVADANVAGVNFVAV